MRPESFRLDNVSLGLLHEVAARGEISVRGRFTAEAIWSNGGPRTYVAGCPSLFLNKRPDLGQVLEAQYKALSQLAEQRPLKFAVSMPSASSLAHRADLLRTLASCHLSPLAISRLPQLGLDVLELIREELVRDRDLAHGERLAQQQAHRLLALIRREPAERALLALGEAHPVLDARGLHGVQQVLALKGQVALEDQHKLAVRKDLHAPDGR